jgi:hypothetical protein
MQSIQVDRLLLLRAGLPDLALRPGALLAARIGERSGAHGILLVAGMPLVAELPEGLEPGTRLRLAVQETSGERVVLQIVPEAAQQAPPAPTVVTLPLPGGATAHLRVEDEAQGGSSGDDDAAERRSVALVYESSALGALHLLISLDPAGVHGVVGASPGTGLDSALAGADTLREALAEAAGRPATVDVQPRREPLDVYA